MIGFTSGGAHRGIIMVGSLRHSEELLLILLFCSGHHLQKQTAALMPLFLLFSSTEKT